MRNTFTCSLIMALHCVSMGAAAAELKIDADYPGGNIIVQQIEGDTVRLCQDGRDTQGWWFYWNFRVNGAAGRTLTFNFTNGDVIGSRGPAVSHDAGQTWAWLGRQAVKGASFSYSFPQGAGEVQFAFALPYTKTDLDRFLDQHKGNRDIAIGELCKTSKGRPVEKILIGKPVNEPRHRILLTCRHHCCESTASYVLEGIMAGILADTGDGKWFRENAEVLVIPFMDKDGVEDGDQGKNRKPRDHNRDYGDESLYASTAALRRYVPEWSKGLLRIAIDLHCPYVREGILYLVGSPSETIWKEQCRFSEILESMPGKSLVFKTSDNIPFGKSWNTANNYKAGKSFSGWACELENVRMVSSIEIPYANTGETTITPDNARAFGTSIVQSIRQYLQTDPANRICLRQRTGKKEVRKVGY